MKIHGVLAVILVPFEEDYSIDFATLNREVDWLFESGVDGVVLAMVSEIFRFTDEERDKLVRAVVSAAKGRGPVIASVGAESIPQLIRNARGAEAAGASALMAIPPTLTRCLPEEISRYYAALLSGSRLPVIIQDASGYAGSCVPMAVQAALFREYPERILFKPEGPQRSQSLTALREATGGDAAIFDGMGGITLIDSFSRGIAGIMGSADLSWAVVELWRALKSGKTERAWQIQAPLSALVALMQSLDAFVVIGKTLFVKQGIFKNPLVRGPLGFKLDRFVELDLDRHLGNLKRACL